MGYLKGENILHIFRDQYLGIPVPYKETYKCKKCDGSGLNIRGMPCIKCYGTGVYDEKRR